MLGGSESMMILSMWDSMSAWCTPTILFCFMNLIIGTIFIASKNNTTKHHDHVQWNSFSPIGRVSSFLERARSVNLSSYTTTTTTAAVAVESQHQNPSEATTPKYCSTSRLAQSIYFPCSSDTRTTLRSSVSSPPEFSNGDERSQSESERHSVSQHVCAPSLLERVKSINFSSIYSNNNTFQAESGQICNSPGQLDRVPSFLDRIKSFKISPAFKPRTPTKPENFDSEPVYITDHHVIKSKSEKTSAKKPPVEMKKSRSEMRISSDEDEDVNVRRPETARARRNADDEEFHLKADDFISKFKQQLKLQRVESFVRFRDMLNRGT